MAMEAIAEELLGMDAELKPFDTTATSDDYDIVIADTAK